MIYARTNLLNIEFRTTGNYNSNGTVSKKFNLIVTTFQSSPEVVTTIVKDNEISFYPDPKMSSMSPNTSSCWTLNQTWVEDMTEAVSNVHSALDCQDLCKERSTNGLNNPDSSYFTWFGPEAPSFNRLCLLYPQTSKPTECTHCVSGQVSCTCSSEVACSLHNDLVIGIHEPVYYEFMCQELCRRNETCTYYSWFDTTGTFFKVSTPHIT